MSAVVLTPRGHLPGRYGIPHDGLRSSPSRPSWHGAFRQTTTAGERSLFQKAYLMRSHGACAASSCRISVRECCLISWV